MSVAANPGVSVGTTNPLTPSWGLRPRRWRRRPTDPLVIHILEPFSTQSLAIAHGSGAHAGRVASAVGFGERETSDDLAFSHLRQPALTLLFAAVRPDREHRQCALDAHETAQPRVARFEFQAGQAVGGGAAAGTPVISAEVHAQQTEFAEVASNLASGEIPPLVPSRRRAGGFAPPRTGAPSPAAAVPLHSGGS